MTLTAPKLVIACALAVAATGCRGGGDQASHKRFDSSRAAATALIDAVKSGDVEKVKAIFGPDAKALVDSSDPETARRNRKVFSVAAAERWRLEENGPDRATLVIGWEDWPFPIPLVKEGSSWYFDTAAGKEEILARRIGRNELSAIKAARTYVLAQRLYAKYGHDGKSPGLYARAIASTGEAQNGLYWPARPGQRRSPLGDLYADAAVEAERRAGSTEPQPFHGYFFRILPAPGAAAPGGAKDYIVNNELAGGFALVAWPAQYDVTGVMTFLFNQDGTVWEKDLGTATTADARAMTLYNPDSSWAAVR